jgi:hypothetical protein
MTLSLYDVKKRTPAGSPNIFTLTLEGIEKTIEVDAPLSKMHSVRTLKLAILETSFGKRHSSWHTARCLEDAKGKTEKVEHAAILLVKLPDVNRTYTKVNTGGVVWVPRPKKWNSLQELYISPYDIDVEETPLIVKMIGAVMSAY